MALKFRVTLESNGNAAFEQPAEEVARILREAADAIEHSFFSPPTELRLNDVNGNRCGKVEVFEEN